MAERLVHPSHEGSDLVVSCGGDFSTSERCPTRPEKAVGSLV